MRILDRLGMLVTSDPVAEIDFALAVVAGRLRQARIEGRTEAIADLLAWTDVRLDERLSLHRDEDVAQKPVKARSSSS